MEETLGQMMAVSAAISSTSSPFTVSEQFCDLRTNLLQGQNHLRGIQQDSFARHAINDRSAFILGERETSGAPDRQQAGSAIPAHTSQKARQYFGAAVHRQRFE